MPEDKGGFNTAFRKRTICEVLREIHDWMDDSDDNILILEIRERLQEALHMAKRMNKKLIEYKRDWDKDMNWEKNLDYEEDLKRRSK